MWQRLEKSNIRNYVNCLLGHWSNPSRISNRQSIFDFSLFLWFIIWRNSFSCWCCCCFCVVILFFFVSNMMNGLTIDLMSHADIMLPFGGQWKKWFKAKLGKRTKAACYCWWFVIPFGKMDKRMKYFQALVSCFFYFFALFSSVWYFIYQNKLESPVPDKKYIHRESHSPLTLYSFTKSKIFATLLYWKLYRLNKNNGHINQMKFPFFYIYFPKKQNEAKFRAIVFFWGFFYTFCACHTELYFNSFNEFSSTGHTISAIRFPKNEYQRWKIHSCHMNSDDKIVWQNKNFCYREFFFCFE